MTREEQRNVEEVVEEAMKPLNELIKKLTSVDGSLAGLKYEVSGIRIEQEYQSRDIEAIHFDMRSMNDTVDTMRTEMPRQWNKDIDVKIESKFSARDDITGAVDAAVEAERLRIEKAKSTSNGFIKEVFRGTGKVVLLLTSVFALTLGGVLLSKCDGEKVDKVDLKALEDSVVERITNGEK